MGRARESASSRNRALLLGLCAAAAAALATPARAQVAVAPSTRSLPNPVDQPAGVVSFTVTSTGPGIVDWVGVNVVYGAPSLGRLTLLSPPQSAFPVKLLPNVPVPLSLTASFGSMSATIGVSTVAGTPTATVTGYNPASNGIYEIYLAEVGAPGSPGTYTFRSGPNHPLKSLPNLGGRSDLLYGGGIPQTSFDTVRSFSTGTDYRMDTVNSGQDDPGFSQVPIGARAAITPRNDSGEVGFDVVFSVTPSAQNPQDLDELTIRRELRVRGASYADSHVDVTTTIRNDGLAPASVGLRYFWDTQIFQASGFHDDGCSFQAQQPNGVTLVTEADFPNPAMSYWACADCVTLTAGNPTPPPTILVFGTVNGPALSPRAPTHPDLVQNVWWRGAHNVPFHYQTTPALDVATDLLPGGKNDNAVAYLFGPTTATAIVIPAGQSVTISASILTAPPNMPPAIIPATGAGLISVSPLAIDFGAVPVSGSAQGTVRASNVGTGPLTIQSITTTTGTGFSSLDRPPFTLQPGDSVVLTFQWSPSSTADVTGTASIVSTTSDGRVVAIALHGTGGTGGGSLVGRLEGGTACAYSARSDARSILWIALLLLALASTRIFVRRE